MRKLGVGSSCDGRWLLLLLLLLMEGVGHSRVGVASQRWGDANRLLMLLRLIGEGGHWDLRRGLMKSRHGLHLHELRDCICAATPSKVSSAPHRGHSNRTDFLAGFTLTHSQEQTGAGGTGRGLESNWMDVHHAPLRGRRSLHQVLRRDGTRWEDGRDLDNHPGLAVHQSSTRGGHLTGGHSIECLRGTVTGCRLEVCG